MLTESLLGLAFSYIAVAALLGGLVVFSNWSLWVRGGCVLLVSALYFTTYFSLHGMLGWPVQDLLPERFLLLASSIQEPDKTTADEGLIHIWVTSLSGDHPAALPRAYELPYTEELHVKLEDALKNQRSGELQIGVAKTLDANDREIPRDMSRLARTSQRIEIGDLPDPRLPEK